MRIIAGHHRGRAILPPRDEKTTRPIVDRVKEALFSRLNSLGMLDPTEPFQAVDIFCGTGSLGLEALSRGARHCWFVERDRDAGQRLERNLKDLNLTDHATILATGALHPLWLSRIPEDQPLRLAFLDPPYAMMTDEADRTALTTLMQRLFPRLETGGVVVLRTHCDDPPLETDGYDGPASFRYGTMMLHFYQRPLNDEASTP